METKTAVPAYEIYAVKFAGPFTSKRAMLLWMEGWDEEMERNYYVFVIKGKEETVIVDVGVRVALAEERQLANFVDPLILLERIGATGKNVKKVILSHIHFDHAGGVRAFSRAFPDALFYAQEKELAFWLGDPIALRRPFAHTSDLEANRDLAELEREGRVVRVDGDRVLMPGLELLLVPGHTPGLQAVAVNTAGGTALVISDGAHIRGNLSEDLPSVFITDLPAWLKSFDKLRAKAPLELIFPGHDIDLARNYPVVAEGITRLA